MAAANDIFLGQHYKLQLGTVSGGTTTYVTISNQLTGSISQSQDKVEVTNKDIKSRRYLGTTIERTGSISGHVDYSDTENFRQLNAAFANQAETNQSVPMRFKSDIAGQDDYTFLAIIDSLELTLDNNAVAEFSMDFTIDGDMDVDVVTV